ncbi:MAG: HupE/UreJ family protein [Burkholderiaceae bacterium]
MRWLLPILLAGVPALVAAHASSTAYLKVEPDPRGAAIEWRIALRDLDMLLDLDADADGRLTWGEVLDGAAGIDALARERLAVRAADARCELRFTPLRYERREDLGFAQLVGRADCAGAPRVLEYRLFEGIDPSHRALLVVAPDSAPRVVAPGTATDLRAAAQADRPRGFGQFVLEGIAHIVRGLDHVLFLVGLMLPALMRREGGRWIARDDLRAAAVAVVWIATAFTAAHSLTLAAASFGWVRISPRVIEPLIAATVLATALNNLWPVVTRRLAFVAFGFGLIHGFGFAEVLAPLALSRVELALALAGFNLGVEIGQLSIVGISFALLAALRRWPGYPRWVLAPGSALLAGVASIWIVERAFDRSILAW